jgi:hypothetical protein
MLKYENKKFLVMPVNPYRLYISNKSFGLVFVRAFLGKVGLNLSFTWNST